VAVFKLEIADEDVDRVFDAVCGNYGWNPDGGETKGDFTHTIVRRFLSDNVTAHENAVAKKAAVEGLNTSVNLSDPEA
tara:strand:+ start:193 stop:426 length:234 start_codon:yes stop_codon:yes gene_type:complete